MSRLSRSVLPTLAIAVGLGLPAPDVLAATTTTITQGQGQATFGLSAAPYTLNAFLAPPDDLAPPPPPPANPDVKEKKKKGGGGGAGISGGPAPGGNPPSSAPPPPPPPPADLAPNTPPGGVPGPPGIGAPPAPTPPGGVAPNAPKAPGVDKKDKPSDADKKAEKDKKKAEKEAKRAEKKAEKEAEKEQKRQEKEQEQAEQSQPPQDPPPQQPNYQQPQQQWPYPYPPPRIIVNPQIQVQVNPKMDIKAEPKANADSDANANAKVEANPVSTATSDVDTTIENKAVINSQGSGSPVATQPVAPTGEGTAPPIVVMPPPAHDDYDPMAGWKKPRKGALITGLVLFGISYGSSAFAGYKLREGCGISNKFEGCKRTANNMFIPVVGPALNVPTSTTQTTQFAMAFASGAQATGALLTVIGAAVLRRDRMRNRALEEAAGLRVADNVTIGSGFSPQGGNIRLTAKF